jgi:hypothetical protein
MFGSKFYDLTLIRTYAAKWGLAEAARELIQNALDSGSPFEWEFIKQDNGLKTLKLRSEFSTLSAEHLLLGKTSKADDESSIGSFGEGFKIALLVLTRLDYPVRILNGAVVWRPSFRFNKTFNDDLLSIEETKIDGKHSGLDFLVENLSDADCEQIRASCLKMQDDVGEVIQTHRGRILLNRPGELYVGTLFICKTELKYGYDIEPQYITLERDRQTVSSWNLEYLTTQMWFDSKRTDDVAKMIAESVPDVSNAQYSSPDIVKEACYKLFQEQYPGHIIASSPAELKELVAKGLTKTVYVGGGSYYNVKNSKKYKEAQAMVPVVKTPTEVMDAWLKKFKYNMHDKAVAAFKEELLVASKWWTVK